MLVYRARPSEQETFGDYLSSLGEKNGFSDVRAFKSFLANSSREHYQIGCSYNMMMRIISGLFVEIGLHDAKAPQEGRRLCFACVNTIPQRWDWSLPEVEWCQTCFNSRTFFYNWDEELVNKREDFCGLMRCSVKWLGLDFSPKKEGLYFADILSRAERELITSANFYPQYKAFLLIE